jgi:2-polyprenyl-3-methyl-5-hydroxy-6-metoxy-1,4-benzoquinol methylase
VSSQIELNRIYEKSWKYPLKCRGETGGTTPNLATIYAKKLADTLDISDFTNQRILDFGAGRGTMLAALSDLNAEVYALDPFAFEYLNQLGFKAFRSLNDLPDSVCFDGIIAIDVIEHLITPWEDIRKINQVLASDGWLFIATLNAQSLNARINRSRWREAQKPTHISFFTSQSLKTIFTRSGFNNLQRLLWLIKYSPYPSKAFLNYVLQALYLDGEIRYLIRK